MPYIGKSPTGTGVRSRYYFTATGGETSLSGASDSGATLSFTDGNYVDVSLNGVALVAGTDYNTTTANTIGGLTALSASDIVEILVYDIFTVADTVPASSGGTFSGGVTINGNLTVTGTSPGNLTGVQTFTSSGTYTPTAGTTKVLVYVVGGGGCTAKTCATAASTATGGVGGEGSSGDINIQGDAGGVGVASGTSSNQSNSGPGGSSHLGGGGRSVSGDAAGNTGGNFGGGASGGVNTNTGTSRNGGVGAAGVVVVYEYE